MVTAQQAPCALDPDRIAGLPHVVAQEGEDHQHDETGKHRSHVVVDQLAHSQQPGQESRTEDRCQHMLAKQDGKAGHRQQQEGDRRPPVHEALEAGKALHLAPGRLVVQLHRALDQPEQQDGRRHHDQQHTAVLGDRPIAPLPPGVALALDQHTGFWSARHREMLLAGTHLAPHRRIVERLRLLARGLLRRSISRRMHRRKRRQHCRHPAQQCQPQRAAAPHEECLHGKPPHWMRLYSCWLRARFFTAFSQAALSPLKVGLSQGRASALPWYLPCS
ncbi:hypothetical protein SDC9_145698 [bioreactor metagenome]|uniref:Uncharacterized protein n=1 Tax=bioreactor metagenome TaxID=1076179 RepID=A0A645E9M8_9ZZZZ